MNNPKNITRGMRIPQNTLLIMFYILLVGSAEAQICSKYFNAPINATSECNICFNSQNEFGMCQITNKTGISENNCRNTCCALQYSNPLPSTCYPQAAEETQKSFTLGTVLVIVFFTIPVVICIIALIHSCVKRMQRSAPPTVPRIRRQEPPLSAINLADYNIQDQYPYLIDINDNCSICLESSCNIVTLCSHPYHSRCLAAWIHKKNKCPLCVSRNFNPIAAYCSKCFKATKLSLIYRKMSPEDTENWIKDCEFTCQTCLAPVKDQFSISIDQQNVQKYQNWKRPQFTVQKQKHNEDDGPESNTEIKRSE